MTDYVKVATAGTTNLAAAAAWTPAGGPPASVTNDTATFNATSLGGSLTGNFTTRRLSFNGATAAVTHSGTITLGADGFQFGTGNTVGWTQSGTVAVGAINQTWSIYTPGANFIFSNVTANLGLTGTGNITIDNADPAATSVQAIWFQGQNTAYTGTITLDNYVRLVLLNAVLTGANFVVSGVGNVIAPSASGATLGASGKTLTINNDVELGFSGRSFTIAPNVVLGAVTRTLTVAGNTTMSGTVTGTAGVIATIQNSTGRVGSSGNNYLFLSGSSSGLTGACVVSGGRFIVAPTTLATSYQPTAIDVSLTGQFEYYQMDGTSFTFPCAPTGTGFICINGNYTAGNGVTFSLGQLASFGGTVRVQPVADVTRPNARIRINDLPAGLDWFAHPNANVAMTGDITYLGSAGTYATNLTLDSTNNNSTAGLTGGVYSLTVPNTSGALVITGTVQRLNTPGTASARMNLTLGGTNTGDNTLSGAISEVGTNGAILGLRKGDAGRWVLSGSNTHTGQHEITGGTLSAQSNTALGAATQATSNTFTVSGSGVLELSGGVSLDKSGTDISLTNTNNPVQSVGGTNTLRSKQLSLASSATTTFNVATGNKLVLQTEGGGVIVGTSAGLTKSGDGELELPAKANTYNGTVTVSAGTLTVGSVANSGFPAAWGQGSTAVDVSGTLRYTGSGGSTTRSVRMNGTGTPTIDASGTGALELNSVTQDTNAKTMVLRGTNTDANTISSLIADNSGAVSLAKEDAGKWVLNGVLAHTGTTTVNGGTLRVETGNNNTASGAVTIGASGTVELITDTLASAGASSGEVLGTGNVTVNGGTIKTRGGATQKGQVRYGGNLTFGTGSTLYIGAAA